MVNPAFDANKTNVKNDAEYVIKLKQKLTAHKIAKEQNQRATVRQERNYNNRIKGNVYEIGLTVYDFKEN